MLFRSLHTDNRVLKFAYEAIRELKMVSYERLYIIFSLYFIWADQPVIQYITINNI